MILEAIRNEPLIERGHPPEVLVANFGDSAVKYLVRVWTTDFSADQFVRDRVRTAIYYAFRRRGITIPYPVQVQMEREWTAPAVDRAALAAALAAAQMFAALTDAQREALSRTARPGLYGEGEAIVREGDAGSSMFVVAGGEAAVTLASSKEPVARLGAGDFFGEMSLLTGDPRTATVTALTDCEVVELAADGFRNVVMADPARRGAAMRRRRRAPHRARAAPRRRRPPARISRRPPPVARGPHATVSAIVNR